MREFFKVGKAENASRYIADMSEVLEKAGRAAEPGAVVALMIGDTVIKDQYLPVTRQVVDAAPDSLSLESIARSEFRDLRRLLGSQVNVVGGRMWGSS